MFPLRTRVDGVIHGGNQEGRWHQSRYGERGPFQVVVHVRTWKTGLETGLRVLRKGKTSDRGEYRQRSRDMQVHDTLRARSVKPSSFRLACVGGKAITTDRIGGKARESRIFKNKNFFKILLSSPHGSSCITWHHLIQKPTSNKHDGCLLTLTKSRNVSKRCG